MEKKKTKKESSACCGWDKMNGQKCSGGIYFFGFIGALVYYISTAGSFGQGVLGVLKAIVWPAFLIFKLLGL
jgi:hypothetical protein